MAPTRAEWSQLQRDPVFRAALGRIFRDLRGPERTQESIAADAHVHIVTVQRIEQGRLEQVALTKLANCARAVGLEVDELVRRARSAPGRMPNTMQIGGAAYIPPIGRDQDRDDVAADLIGSRGVVLFGAPGQGKTTLARYVAASLCEGFKHGVFEVDLESERQIENLPRLIANELGQADLSGSYDVLRGRSILLILDSVDLLLRDTPAPRFREAISAITRSMSKDSRLIITCQRNLEKQELVTREVRPLRDAAALELFHQMSDGLYRQDSAIDVAEFVCGVLAGHPLSIKIVARYGRAISLPLDDLRRLWEEKWRAIAEAPTASLDQRGLRASFELAFEGLPDQARALILTLGLLPDGISPNLVKEVWPEQETDIYDGLRSLRDYSLLDDLEGGLRRNKLRGPLFVFAAVKLEDLRLANDPAASEQEAATHAIDHWVDKFINQNAPQFGDSDPWTKAQLVREQFHNIHASLDRRLELSTEPSTLAAATSVLALYWAYHNNLSGTRNPISSTEDAIKYLEKAQAIFLGNSRKADATRCTYYIGNIHWLRGDIPKAQRYLLDAEGSDDVSDEMKCDIKRAFAHIEYKEGNIGTSVKMFQDVIGQAAGRFDDCVRRCWVGLIDAYRKLDQLDKARALMADIEGGLESCSAEILGNLRRGHAYVLMVAGRLDEAIAEYQRALDAFHGNEFGQAHCWRGLGDIHVRKNELGEEQASAAFETAMQLYDNADKNPSLGVALVTLGRGRLAQAQGEVQEALQLYRAAAEQLDRQHLNEPYELAVAHELIGDALTATSECDKARAEYSIASNYFARVGADRVADRVRAKMA